MKSSSRRDQYTVVLESLRSDFKVFGEALSAVRDEVKDNSAKLLRIEAEIINLRTDLEMVKAELAIIRHGMITRDEFKFLETRVNRLEKVISRR